MYVCIGCGYVYRYYWCRYVFTYARTYVLDVGMYVVCIRCRYVFDVRMHVVCIRCRYVLDVDMHVGMYCI